MALYPIVGVAVGVLLAVLINLYWIATLAIIVLPLAGFFLRRWLQKRTEARAS